MTDTATPARKGEVIPSGLAGQPLRPELVAAYATMLGTVPDAGGDGLESILEAIAGAPSVDAIDAPWRSAGLEDYIGRPIQVRAIRKMTSEYDGGLPWFLIIDAADRLTGELITATSGSVSVVAQLAKLWSMGAFPVDVIVRQSDRPSASGYYPQHLELLRTGNGRS